MASIPRVAFRVVPIVLALGVSAVLYSRSRSADFDGHAHAIGSIGSVRHFHERLSEEVLATRFGLINQYDSMTATEVALTDAVADLRADLSRAVPIDAEIEEALSRLGGATTERRASVERFKSANSVLRNSLRYLPKAAQDAKVDVAEGPILQSISRATEAALVFSLIGDDSTRRGYLAALADLDERKVELLPEPLQRTSVFITHARAIAKTQPAVDEWVKKAVSSGVGDRLGDVEGVYHDRFNRVVAKSNLYRKVLYGWSIALVVAIAVVGSQLFRLYTELERRVKERTAELARALSELWGEMKLARKIQEALVPDAPALDECDVAASMKPTDQVGGDYYDVLRAGRFEWILIGDVSGHGVPAGLVMMMCQTAVRTAIERDPEIAPDRLLAVVNSVLTSNIRKLGENKYMTISAFRREADGTVEFSGAHQEVLIFRAESGTVDTLEVEGPWIGLKDEIADALTTRRFRLDPNDVLVLFSDGITEATRGDAMFEPEGIRRVLAGARGKTSAELLDSLNAELAGYAITDDATVLVVRQLPRASDGTDVVV